MSLKKAELCLFYLIILKPWMPGEHGKGMNNIAIDRDLCTL